MPPMQLEAERGASAERGAAVEHALALARIIEVTSQLRIELNMSVRIAGRVPSTFAAISDRECADPRALRSGPRNVEQGDCAIPTGFPA
jgi:hypothetical protein